MQLTGSGRKLSTLLLAGVSIITVPAHELSAQTAAPDAIELSLPVVVSGRILPDDLSVSIRGEEVLFDRASLLAALEDFLSDSGATILAERLPEAQSLTRGDLERAGITARYDAERLEIVVDRIDPALARQQTLAAGGSSNPLPVTLQPERFSAYVNAIGNLRLQDFEDLGEPGVLLFGAARYGNFVLEAAGGYEADFEGPGFYRGAVRGVYDDFERLRRYSAGDLAIQSLRTVGSTLLGGIAIEHGRTAFNQFGPLRPSGSNEILLDRPATVDVFVGDTRVDTIELTPGSYDLAQLPSRYGSGDVRLVVNDVASRQVISNFDLFFDPQDLVAGEDEYGAAIGFPTRNFAFTPSYDSDLALTAFYRRGLTERLVAGGAIQASENLQLVSGEVRISPRWVPGRFEIGGAVRTGDQTGFALRSAFFYVDRTRPGSPSVSLSVDFESSGYATLSDPVGFRGIKRLTGTGTYSQPIGERTSLTAGFSVTQSPAFRDDLSVFADVFHNMRRNIRLSLGAEYGSGRIFGGGLGVRASVLVRFGERHRFDSRYNSRRERFTANFARSYREKVGEFGYDIGVSRTDGDARIDGSANYVGNRFEARVTHASAGPGFGSIGQSDFTRLQVGTSIALAGGQFAIGRPISDSFVIAKPAKALAGTTAILGGDLRGDSYEAASGTLGPALQNRLFSFSRQTISYDLRDSPTANVGTGSEVVLPPFRSGYRLEVGNAAYVSSVGTLYLNGERAELVTGYVEAVDDEDFVRTRYFTNSAGRFAVLDLRPGKRYRVLLDDGGSFEFTTPDDGTGLLNLRDVSVVASPADQEGK